MFRFLKCLSLVTLSVLVASCAKTSSDDVKTTAWTTRYELTVEGGRVVCLAKYQVGGKTGTFIELDSGDYVDCNGQSMGRADSVIGEVIYKTSLPRSLNGTYSLTLHRKGEKDYIAYASLPDPVQLIEPANGTLLRKQTAFDIKWAPSTSALDSMAISFFYTDPNADPHTSQAKSVYFSQASESGHQWIGAESTPSTWIRGDVPATISLLRSRRGVMPADLQGTITSYQEAESRVTFR